MNKPPSGLGAAILLVWAGTLSAATYTVTNTNDSGPGSLRQAILDANASVEADLIAFAIPGPGVHTIMPTSELPWITGAATIDGYTQPGASPNTQLMSDDAVLLIELNGEDSDDFTGGLVAGGVGTTIRGLVINRFGINVALGDGNHLEGCFIGTDPTGTIARSRPEAGGVSAGADFAGSSIGGTLPSQRNVISGNNGIGISIFGAGPAVIQGNFIGIDVTGAVALPNDINVQFTFYGAAVVGGPATPTGAPPGNVISGSRSYGIWGSSAIGDFTMTIQGNLIGTNATGTAAIPNKFHGIRIVRDTPGPGTTLVGGVHPEDGNVIAYNLGDGISTAPESAESFVNIASRSNSIHSNTGLGIDLYGNGVTPNTPGGGRNYPVLTAAVSSGGSTTIQGTLNSVPGEAGIEVEFFSNAECDASGHGEGALPIGSTVVSTDGSGNANFSVVLPISLEPGSLVTSTASVRSMVTSEFSACRLVTDGVSFQLLGVTPRSGDAAGGTFLTVAGTGFLPGALLTIGGIPAGNVVVVDSTTISATAPVLPPGTLNDVSVTNPSGGAGGATSATATLPAAWMADFVDVPQGDIFHDHVAKVFRSGITAGCGGGYYCRDAAVRRDHMAVFLLKAMHGAAWTPPPCAAPGRFLDVACPGPFTDWVEQLWAEDITSGCGVNVYCPDSPVRRDQMAAFLLKAFWGPGYVPPVCIGTFPDVPCPSLFADWIEDLAAREITGGCGGGNFCPASVNTRGQMAVFLAKAFSLP